MNKRLSRYDGLKASPASVYHRSVKSKRPQGSTALTFVGVLTFILTKVRLLRQPPAPRASVQPYNVELISDTPKSLNSVLELNKVCVVCIAGRPQSVERTGNIALPPLDSANAEGPI